MAEYNILEDEPWRLAMWTQGRRVAYVNGYLWALISGRQGYVYLYRSGDKGATWTSKGTVYTATDDATLMSVDVFCDYSNDIVYWCGHEYTGSHRIITGSLDLSDADNPSGLDTHYDVTSQTTTTGCYFPQITRSGTGYFWLCYQTSPAGASPYNEYYTLISANATSTGYQSWSGSTELNVDDSNNVRGYVQIERERGGNGVCIAFLKFSTNQRFQSRFNSAGNSNTAPDWAGAVNISTSAAGFPLSDAEWMGFKILQMACRSNGDMYVAASVNNDTRLYYTTNFASWSEVDTGGYGSSDGEHIAMGIVDGAGGNDLVQIYHLDDVGNCTHSQRDIVGAATTHETGLADMFMPSCPEYVPLLYTLCAPVYQHLYLESEFNWDGTWTSEARLMTEPSGWGNMWVQTMKPPSGTLTVETNTGGVTPIDGTWEGWTAATQDPGNEYLYTPNSTINSTTNKYVAVRLTFGTNSTPLKQLIPSVPVGASDPSPIEINYISGQLGEPHVLTWYHRYTYPIYN